MFAEIAAQFTAVLANEASYWNISEKALVKLFLKSLKRGPKKKIRLVPQCKKDFLAPLRGNRCASPAQRPSERPSKGSLQCAVALPSGRVRPRQLPLSKSLTNSLARTMSCASSPSPIILATAFHSLTS